MKSTPDNSLDIFWGILFDNGSIALDQTPAPGDTSEWFKVQSEADQNNLKAVEIKLFAKDKTKPGAYKKISIDSNGSENFFFSKKFIINLGEKDGHQAFGIGYYCKTSNLVKISWFDTDLNLIETEQRNIEKCADLLIPKIGIQTSYRN